MSQYWPLSLVVGFGLLTFVSGLKLSLQTASLLSTAVLVATFVAVTWYSMETRILRLQQQSESELRNHPWLRGSDLTVNKDKNQGGLLGREELYLTVKNVGATPAHDLQLNVAWRIEGQEPASGQRNIRSITIAPEDTYHMKLCDIDFEIPGDRAVVDVELSYRSFMGGGGRLQVNFYSHEKGWANGPTSYEFWLSDGKRFPEGGTGQN